MDDPICRNCEHGEDDHPNRVFCMVDDCRCPGWTKFVEGIVD